MSDEIVRRLFSKRSRHALTESLKSLNEVDEDEDEDITHDEEEDFSPEDDIVTGDESPEDFEVPEDEPTPSTRGPLFDEPMDDIPDDEEGEVPEPESEEESDPSSENVNPLDNPYAVKFQLGDEVVLSYANGTKTEMKGTVEGYDKVGFYRIKWADGMTTNGITDIALQDLVDTNAFTNEGKCVCGSKKRIREGKYIVCDKCGRRLNESPRILDMEGGKKMIRSEHRPMSTSSKPGIEESIKKAFSRKSLKEDVVDEDIFSKLYTLEGEFWTRLQEIVADIEDLGYDVLEANDEYIIVGATDGDEDHEIQIFLGGTDRTKTLDFKRIRR